MKALIPLVTLMAAVTLASCEYSPKVSSSQDTAKVITSSSGSEPTQWKLVSGSTGTIKLDLDARYTYLDSLNKSYSSGSLKDILSAHPHTIIYFYPKDGTPNCTIQALDFSTKREEFAKLGYGIIGVSKDDLESHKAFAERNELTIPLLQDGSGSLMKSMWALGELQEYGNGAELSDIIRSTFIVDKNGNAEAAFTDVIARGHADRIMEYIKNK